MFGKYVNEVRKQSPLVHNITNYVTVNDVANVILACGASPIMADEPKEVEEITEICQALNINIGTLHQSSIDSMKLALARANEKNHITLLDPVGAGASKLRTATALELLKQGTFTVIRGNSSEIRTLINGTGHTKGVDAGASDAITEENVTDFVRLLKEFAKSHDTIVVVTGETDIVTDGEKTYFIRNGKKEMSSITGSGCQLSGLIAAFVAASPQEALCATAAAVAAMGLAGEIAYENLQEGEGNATYRNRIIDAIYHMNGEILEGGIRVEEF